MKKCLPNKLLQVLGLKAEEINPSLCVLPLHTPIEQTDRLASPINKPSPDRPTPWGDSLIAFLAGIAGLDRLLAVPSVLHSLPSGSGLLAGGGWE